ncbi:hypothetical protein P280DRAFT_554752 [Massarina eburnea CBS 473.64]|uniref:F-box domain-containing protein n=1 Tax=Massarina eburnea CBS 473.64 TaxID=1395130 RepID=A0A6A6RJR1_9PLEO|nr:hypothetical protein P280DRAFT_554752 [Massarina eburnea CBS 473.64]
MVDEDPRCRLLELPGEVRNRIYYFATVGAGGLTVLDSPRLDADSVDPDSFMGLMHTCRQIRKEFRLPYIRDTYFRLDYINALRFLARIVLVAFQEERLVDVNIIVDFNTKEKLPRFGWLLEYGWVEFTKSAPKPPGCSSWPVSNITSRNNAQEGATNTRGIRWRNSVAKHSKNLSIRDLPGTPGTRLNNADEVTKDIAKPLSEFYFPGRFPGHRMTSFGPPTPPFPMDRLPPNVTPRPVYPTLARKLRFSEPVGNKNIVNTLRFLRVFPNIKAKAHYHCPTNKRATRESRDELNGLLRVNEGSWWDNLDYEKELSRIGIFVGGPNPGSDRCFVSWALRVK